LEQGFDFTFQDRVTGMMRNGYAQFRAPYVISYAGEFSRPNTDQIEAVSFNLTVLMSPIKPGWSRTIIYSGPGPKKKPSSLASGNDVARGTKPKTLTSRSLRFKIFSLLPTWLIHQLSNRFLDSDLAFLHYQEQERLVKRKVDSDGYCMPAPADRGVAAVRRWVQKYAHIPTMETVLGKSRTAEQQSQLLPSSPTDRTVLFDHLTQHTDQCKHCSKALNGVKKWRRNTCLVMGAGVLLGKFLAARLVVVACLALLRLLAKAEKSFMKGSFDHYKNQ
jgi:hypothetical protein